MNGTMVEFHGATNKGDPIDPTLSYGVQKNYPRYRINQLAA